MSALWLLKYAYAFSLMITPGACISFSPLGRPLQPELRLVAALVLSPLVLSLEIAVPALVGFSFGAVFHGVVPLNLVGILPLLRARYRWHEAIRTLPILVVALALLAPLVPPMAELWYVREYGWHNMMQIAAIDQIYALPKIPEEADIAGLRLNYPWLGHALVAVISMIVDRPPTILTPAINFVQFLAMFVFLVAAARRLGVLGWWRASLASGVALITPGLIDIAWTAATSAIRLSGELRITPPSEKFMYIDAMVFGMSSFAMLVYLATRCLTNEDERIIPLLSIASLACGILYPLMFPSCLVVVGVLVVCALAARHIPQYRLPSYRPAAIVTLIVAMAIVTAVIAAYLMTIGTSAATRPIALVPRWEIRKHLTQIFYVFGPVILALIPSMLRWLRARDGARLTLVGTSALLLTCYVVFAMPTQAEYKFLFTALFIAVPVLACCMADLARTRVFGLAILTAALLVIDATDGWVMWNWQIPPKRYATAQRLDEATLFVRPAEGWEGSWMQAVRDRTPPDTVLLTGDTVEPVSVFTRRSVYVMTDWTPSGPAGEAAIGRNGYTMSRVTLLEKVKGYSVAEIASRLRVLHESLSAKADETQIRRSLAALARLRRPVAFHFAEPSALEDWLPQKALGHLVFQSATDRVWLISTGELAATAGGA